MSKKIAVQGFKGCFHEMAAYKITTTKPEVVYCDSFSKLIQTAENGDACDGLIAIENSIAGSILANYNLLNRSKLFVTGETYLNIEQQLIALPGVELKDVKEVRSHPMALQQCHEYLEQGNWKLVETTDTAEEVAKLAATKEKHVAVIAGKLAADIFSMQIIAENIHSEKYNYTRFLLLSSKQEITTDANKASVYFEVAHAKGALAKILHIIAENDINLSKLQSIPVPGSNWQYGFYADMEFANVSILYSVMDLLASNTPNLRLQGVYKNGK